jgi:uncharacterized protein (DUF362 family)
MDRREFLKITACAGAGLTLGPGLRGLVDNAIAAGRPDLAVAQGKSASAITRAAVDALGGMRSFVSKGDIVVVKPNIAWDRTPEQAANTNPEVVAEVVKMCFEAGAKKVKVFDNTCNAARRCYKQSGIADAARAVGADVSFVDDRRFREVPIKGRALKSWPLYAPALEADTLINVPIAKHHGLAELTMAMKNWMGLMGGNRGRIHQNLGESLADLALVIKPDLTVLDAVRILTANGPQGGNLKDVKRLDTVIAGVDQVAVDSFGATLFGKKADDLGYLRAAKRAGLGRTDIKALNIKRINV